MNRFNRAFAIASLVLPLVSFAGGHRAGQMGPDGMAMSPKIADELNLSEAQKQDFAALMEMYAPRFKELKERGEADRKTLMELAPDDPAYDEMTARVSQEAGLAAAEAVQLMSELQSNVYALLTPDQQARYLELRVEKREAMQAKREEHRKKMEERRAARQAQ